MTDELKAVLSALKAYVQEAAPVPSTPTLLIALEAATAMPEPQKAPPAPQLPPLPPKASEKPVAALDANRE